MVNGEGMAANMSEEEENSTPQPALAVSAVAGAAPGKVLSPEAVRALAEAEERRRVDTPALPTEYDGPSGGEPTRYGDWERKGLAVDF